MKSTDKALLDQVRSGPERSAWTGVSQRMKAKAEGLSRRLFAQAPGRGPMAEPSAPSSP
jgi:hypothetical protein